MVQIHNLAAEREGGKYELIQSDFQIFQVKLKQHTKEHICYLQTRKEKITYLLITTKKYRRTNQKAS